MTLQKGPNGLGWTLQERRTHGPDGYSPVFVTSLVEGGPAKSGGVLVMREKDQY